jgi:hypothetical protein
MLCCGDIRLIPLALRMRILSLKETKHVQSELAIH